ncbi:MAG: hypothetical protein LBK06_00840 [Planctomycetaceae bacterium]|jgi:hypothetical protein|nr:hypothetical protein [Planctomycetaceae bacterium]
MQYPEPQKFVNKLTKKEYESTQDQDSTVFRIFFILFEIFPNRTNNHICCGKTKNRQLLFTEHVAIKIRIKIFMRLGNRNWQPNSTKIKNFRFILKNFQNTSSNILKFLVNSRASGLGKTIFFVCLPQSFFVNYAEAVLKFAKLNTAAQQREAVVQGRSLLPYRLRYNNFFAFSLMVFSYES